MWDSTFGQEGWNLRFIRAFNDWELDLVGDLLTIWVNWLKGSK